jgi:hypothetical protein
MKNQLGYCDNAATMCTQSISRLAKLLIQNDTFLKRKENIREGQEKGTLVEIPCASSPLSEHCTAVSSNMSTTNIQP